MALISVVAVLVLLTIVATPFLITMRDSMTRGERFLYSARADWEAESLFELTRSHLVGSLEHIERRRLDELAIGADGSTRPPATATPTSDTLDELQLPEDTLARFNEISNRDHRVWGVDVIDLQSRVNINRCGPGILANIIGRSELADNLSSDAGSIELVDASMFPPDGGVVRVGSEVVKYEEVIGNSLSGCERGYRADLPENGSASDWEASDPVMLEAAVQISTRAFRTRPGAWVRFTNVYQARAIANEGVATLPADRFDMLRPHITAWNGDIIGDGWSNPQLIRNALGPTDASQLYAEIKNLRYFGPGTIVRITDGVNNDYAVVTKVRGTNQVLLAGKIEHDYDADQARMYSLARSPVNINTATIDMLTYCFEGLRRRGRSREGAAIQPSGIDRQKAGRLADFLKTWTVSDDDTQGVYRNWEDFTNALSAARDEQGIIDENDFVAIMRNAMNANDSTLAFSTVPFVFHSFDMYEVRATASLMDRTGRERSRRELSRVISAASTRSGTYILETQADFQNQIMKSRDAKWFATFPDNVNAFYDGPNIPASEYFAFAQKSRFPSTDRATAVGDVRLLPAAFRFANSDERDRVHHFDESDLPDGQDTDEAEVSFNVEGPYSVEDNQIDLIEFVDVEGYGDDIEVGIKDFALSFWYQPKWTRGGDDQVIFDYGSGDEFTNRISLIYDPDNSVGDVLVLSVADATREQQAASVFYEFDHTTWDAEQWYHIGVHIGGSHPGQIELFIDGEKQGRAAGITRLTSSVPPTGDVLELRVEETDLFPNEGVLMVRAPEGMELFEYANKTDNSFIVTRRKARNIIHADQDDEPRSHAEGAVVELYGFVGGLMTDIERGGSSVHMNFGPMRIYRLTYEGDECVLSDSTSDTIVCRGLANPPNGTSVTGVTLTEWDTGSDDPTILDDLGGTGSRGLALIISPTVVWSSTDPAAQMVIGPNSANGNGELQSFTVGGSEIVEYSVTNSGEVEIRQRNVNLRHANTVQEPDGNRFFPSYEYGETTPDNQAGPDANGVVGAPTAFIPLALVGDQSGEYLDPADNEPQTGGVAYVQVDGEWFLYDTFDTTTLSPQVCWYRDLRIQDLTNIWGVAGTIDTIQGAVQASPLTGEPGGSGGNSSPDFVPQRAQDFNDGTASPAEPQGGTGGTPPPYTAMEIVEAYAFRGMELPGQDEEYRVANTIPADHSAGTNILPTFMMVSCNEVIPDQFESRRGAFAGFQDLLTMRDPRLNDEHVRVQWGYQEWVGLTQQTTQTWQWERPDRNIDLERYESRIWTRVLKFPSGELPDAGLTTASETFYISKEDGGVVSSAVVDEVYFPDQDRPPADRPKWALLGEVPSELLVQPVAGSQPIDPRYAGMDDSTTDFKVHLNYFEQSVNAIVLNGLPIDEDLFPDDGGVLKIDDEIILYGDFDPGSGQFSDCVRGCFGTEPRNHEFGARVIPINTFPASALSSPADESSASFQLVDASDFPDNGYLRIADSGEIAGYTEREGNNLSGPLGRIDPTTLREGEDEDARVGGALFRARFGTIAEGYSSGDVAVAMPFRHYDRYAERSDDPENSYVQLSWTKPSAVWKRVTWTRQPRELVEVIALIRFAGGPAWDSDRIIAVGQDQPPRSDRRKWLYQITDPGAENLLNVESDRMEVRLMVRFAGGAYDRFADIAPDNWKETPWIQKVAVEYVAPPSILYEDK